jgi:hypothetical protein
MSGLLKSQLGRASLVLTSAEVAGSTLSLEKAKDAVVCVDFNFTQGMLTNGTIRFYVSNDASTWEPVKMGVTILSEAHTADASFAYFMPQLRGWKFFRATLQGSGTVTNSLGDFTYRFGHSRSRR